MSEGRGGGYSRSTIYSQLPRGTFWNRPPGYIYNQIILFKWNGSGWGSCRDSGGYTNQVTTYGFFLTWNFGSNPPCGVGYYGTAANAYVWDGGRWRGQGGGLWSGYLHLSGSLLVAADESVAPPADSRPQMPKPPRNKPGIGPGKGSPANQPVTSGENMLSIDAARRP